MPFRTRYLTYDEMARTMRAWADAHPDFVQLTSLGKSPEGRDYLLLVIGRDRDRVRPAAWVDGNMHATELCGSSVALAIAEDVIALHSGKKSVRELPDHVCDRLRETLFYVLPRMCPDGVETVLREGRYVRSNPRDTRHHAPVPRWKLGDVDGDGQVLVMRKEDPNGDYVEHPDMPGLLLPRRIEYTGPFYKVWPEGHIEHFDGVTVPDPFFLSDNDTDMNRNFPWSWAPEHEQMGAGKFATSEPEARAVVEFATAHPNIFAWLNLHTFGGCHIRPLGHAPDSKMDPSDLALYNQLEAWGQEFTGYPTVSGYHDFLYEPDKPLHGDEVDFAYHQRGAFAYTTELWDLFAQLGIARKKPFTDHYRVLTRDDLLALARWDRDKNAGRVMRPWKKTTHPQLGEVEVGGMNGLVGISNPPYEMIADICERHSKMFLRIASLAPELRVEPVRTTRVGESGWRVEVSVENRGYLPTYILSSAKSLSEDARVFATCESRGPTVFSDARVEVGHLSGWGRGLYDAGSSIFHQRSRGSGSRRVVAFTGEGHGVLQIRAAGLRTGAALAIVEV
ncbi:MAG TPA: M14 family metallopeptidase [Polyangiaceae bacterium]|nr:M14 family metallopeptidase [Polyangiaceae bacterium]